MATARPWNDDIPAAALAFIRGGASILEASADRLIDFGVAQVISQPLLHERQKIWVRAGFKPFKDLLLFERDLVEPVPVTDEVRTAESSDWSAAAQVDRAAFAEFWRMGSIGLSEAASVTRRSVLRVVDVSGNVAGFCLTGVDGTTAYLQRVAVHPTLRGRGIGRSLVRDAARWAQAKGALTMLLNTQPGNEAADRLYVAEGFTKSREGLLLMKKGS